MNIFRKFINILLFRYETQDEPVTAGLIVWGVLARSFILIIAGSVLIPMYNLFQYWYISLFVLWIFAFYPAWQKYTAFQNTTKSLTEETLCGSCVHFSGQNQLCTIYDEHVSKDYIPCEGESWEPRSYEITNQ